VIIKRKGSLETNTVSDISNFFTFLAEWGIIKKVNALRGLFLEG